MSTSSLTNNDWLTCAKWLNQCQCLPAQIGQRLQLNELTLNEFANALRDGEILCNLVNYLQPGSVDMSQINRRAQVSAMLSLNNIRLFLAACKSPGFFNMNESDLFDEHMLYNCDLVPVIKALHGLSKCAASRERGGDGFELGVENSASANHDDIYYNINPAEIDSPESYYTDDSFILGNFDNDPNSPNSRTSTDSGVYQLIVQQSHHHHHQPLKRDFVIREIVNTEENFLNGLNTLMSDFLTPLSTILTPPDKHTICINIESLVKLHKSLYDDLFKKCQGGPGRTGRICEVFDAFKLSIMREYAEYFSSIDRSLSKCDSLVAMATQTPRASAYALEFKQKLDECRRLSKRGNFKLTDLLRLPYQRVLKYHLLFNELLKQTDVEHSAKENIKRTRDNMCEVGNYLNECQRDKENLTQVEKIMAQIVVDCKQAGAVVELKNYGHFIRDDKFRVKSVDLSERIARTRTFFLFEKALIICKAKGDLYSYKEALLIDEFNVEEVSGSAAAGGNSGGTGILSSVIDLTSATSSGGGSNAHTFMLYNSTRSKGYTFYFKNQEQKRVWKQCILQAKQKVQPAGQRHNKHIFLLSNFEHQMTQCDVCKSHLLGIFYQGYKCELCPTVAHKDCLTKASQCTAIQSPPPLVTQKSRTSSQIRPVSLERSVSSVTKHSIYTVRAIHKYEGRPAPPEPPALHFNIADLIQVTDDDDEEFWRGYVLKPAQPQQQTQPGCKETEGYFPKGYVKACDSNESLLAAQLSGGRVVKLEEYCWYAPVDRSMADLILHRIPNPTTQTIFMVRCRQEGGYAVSIKYNGIVDHIRVNVNSSHVFEQFTQLYSIDQRNFSSVVNLVMFYCNHTLRENFPQLDTTLGLAYRDALPKPVAYATPIHDYNPMENPHNNGEQIELKRGARYSVLNKEANGWWRVFNSDGLIGYAPGGYLQEIKK